MARETVPKVISNGYFRLILQRVIKPILPYGLVLLFSLPAVWSLIQPGFFTSHDGDWMVVRLSAFHQSLRDGHFPVRWTQRLNNNFGYPVLNFLYPLPFYLAEPLVLAGLGFVNSVKILFLLSLVGSSLIMFLWLKRQAGLWPGLVGAILYLYTPYRFLDVYVRGSLGESLGFLMVPLVFLALDRLKDGPVLSRSALVGLAFAGLILVHNVFGMIFGFLTFGYLGYQAVISKSGRFLIWGMIGLGWGVIIAAFFWYPALTETSLTRFPQTVVADYRGHFPSFRQLLYSKWGWEFSVSGTEDRLSLQVGLANYLAVIMAVFLFFRLRSRQALFFLLSFAAGFLLMLSVTRPLWQWSRVLPLIQFPWRLLALTTFASAAAIGLSLKNQQRSLTWLIGGAVILLALVGNRDHLGVNSRTFYPDTFYSTNEATTTVKEEYLPKWSLEPLAGRAEEPVELVSGQGQLTIREAKTGRIFWSAGGDEPLKIRINALYYPGWKYLIDGQEISPDIELTGTPLLEVPAGRHQLTALWTETRPRLAANLLSLIAFGVALLVLIKNKPNWWPGLGVLILGLGTVMPLFRPGWIPIHDDTQVARVYEMAQALRQGQLPVRWVGNLGYGYGYPLFNYYAPLPYYFGALINLLGANPLVATKLMVITGMLLSGIGAFAFLRPRTNGYAALLGTALYLYLPFRAVELYVRGAIGELWGMAFLPLALASVDGLIAKRDAAKQKLWVVFAALALAGLLLSHNLTALIGLPVIFAYALMSVVGQLQKRKLINLLSPLARFQGVYPLAVALLPDTPQTGGFDPQSDQRGIPLGTPIAPLPPARRLGVCSAIKILSVALGLALGLSAFYWLPAWFERRAIDTERLVAGGGGDFREHFLFLDQLWDSPWGFAGSAPGRADGISFKIGKLHLLIGAASLGLALVRRESRRHRLIWFLVVVFGFSLVMTLSVSQPLWEVGAALLSFMQYPWRFLVLITLAVSLLGGLLPLYLAGVLPDWHRNRSVGLVTLLLVGAVVGVNLKYFRPQKVISVRAQDLVTPMALRWEASKRSDEFLPPGFLIPQDQDEVPVELVKTEKESLIKIDADEYHYLHLTIETAEENTLFLNKVAFPGWQVWLDGERPRLINDFWGRMRLGLVVPPGRHQITARLTNTPVRTWGNLISLVSCLIVLSLVVLELKSWFARGLRSETSRLLTRSLKRN